MINLSSLAHLSVIFSHLSVVYFAPSIHKPPYKADFSGRLIAQHRRSLFPAWGPLGEWDDAAKDSGNVSQEWNIDRRKGHAFCPWTCGHGTRGTQSMSNGEESLNKHTNPEEKSQTESDANATVLSSLFPRRCRYLLPPPQPTTIRFSCTSLDAVYFQTKGFQA